MTIDRFRNLVFKLSNYDFVRNYLFLNYPHGPSVMGIEFLSPKLKRGFKVDGRLAENLRSEGFEFNSRLGIWVVNRDEVKAMERDEA